MALRKHKKANLRHSYRLFVEVGLVMALLAVIMAFRLNIQPEPKTYAAPEMPANVVITEIPITEQRLKPPPPPRPQIIVEVPNDVIIDEEPLVIDVPFDIGTPLIRSEPPAIGFDNHKDDIEPADTFIVVEHMPQLIGGLGEIQKKIKYPEIARKAGLEGRVVIQFIVDENGEVSSPEFLRKIGGGCDEEALRVLREARFTPGMQRGKAVKVKMSLPITFKLK